MTYATSKYSHVIVAVLGIYITHVDFTSLPPSLKGKHLSLHLPPLLTKRAPTPPSLSLPLPLPLPLVDKNALTPLSFPLSLVDKNTLTLLSLPPVSLSC